MTITRQVHDAGQSLWLDNITRKLLNSGTLRRYIDELNVTGLTSNPTIFEHAIAKTVHYDAAIKEKSTRGLNAKTLFFELALEDLSAAADLLLPNHTASAGMDGFVSLEVSPDLAYDSEGTLKAALELHAQGGRPNLFIKIPGTPAGIKAIEDTIFAGVPVNVTLLFSPEQYVAAAQAYMRGIERRLAAGLDPAVASVASLFISRWDVAISDQVGPELRNRLGIAIAGRAYRLYCELLASPRWRDLANADARPQRLLWASTGTKDASLPDTFYIDALVAPGTVNTIPENTLLAFADHGHPGAGMSAEGKDAERVLADFKDAGVDIDALAARLQEEGAQAFSDSWDNLMACIVAKQG